LNATVNAKADEITKLTSTIADLNAKVAALAAELEKAKDKDSSSSSDDKDAVSDLKNKIAEQDEKITALQSDLKEAHAEVDEKAAEAESAQAQLAVKAAQAQQAHEANEATKSQLAGESAKYSSLEATLSRTQKENHELKGDIENLQEKVRSLEADLQNSSRNSTGAVSPRGGGNSTPKGGDGSIPAWKLRQMEKEKEEEEKRAADRQAKLTKVSSIKVKTGELYRDSGAERPNFKDPRAGKDDKHPGSQVVEEPISAAALLGSGKTVEELEAEEEARVMRNLGRGGQGKR